MMYISIDTGEFWSEEEIREEYNNLWELHDNYPTFDEYLEHLLDLGRNRMGGIIPAGDEN